MYSSNNNLFNNFFNNSFISGLVAGSVGSFVVFPIDVIKTRMQNQNSINHKLYKKLIIQ